MTENIVNVLRKTPLLASLTGAEMQPLASRAIRRSLKQGEQLFAEGDPCMGLLLVASGKIRIFKLSASGREQVLAMEGAGSSFAELPVFDGGNYPAAAAASEDAELVFISRKKFQNFCREHPDVALKVIAVVGARLRRLVGIIEELSFTTVRQRLIALILQLAERDGKRSKEGIHTPEASSESLQPIPPYACRLRATVLPRKPPALTRKRPALSYDCHVFGENACRQNRPTR